MTCNVIGIVMLALMFAGIGIFLVRMLLKTTSGEETDDFEILPVDHKEHVRVVHSVRVNDTAEFDGHITQPLKDEE